LVRALSGFTVVPAPESGDKLTRFGPFSSQCRAGNVKILRGLWNEDLFALALNPNSALAWNASGWAQGFSNRPDLAIEALQRAMRLSPLDPRRWNFYGGLALAHLVAGRHEEATEWADRALHEQPRATAVLGFKAAACGHLGRVEEGGECVRRLLKLRPGFTVASAKKALGTFVSPEVIAIFLEGYRKAGMPEE
jgi:adenylate cyclase